LWRETRRRVALFLDENKPRVMFSEVVQSMPCYAAYLECKQRNIPFVQVCGSRLPGRMEIFVGETGIPLGLDTTQTPSNEAMKLGREFIDKVRSKAAAGPDYMKIFRKKKVFLTKNDFSKGLLYLKEQLMGGVLEPTAPPFWHPFVSKFTAARAIKKHSSAHFFMSLDDVRKIPGPKLLFPLHVTPEASTDWWAPTYANMLDVIQNVMRRLPPGWTLVAKEHPSSVFLQRKPAELKAIKAIDRVVLVGPHEPSEELLRECQGLLVISSTMGLEMAIKGYPVISLSHPFYDLSGNTLPCDSYDDLPAALENARSYKPNPGQMLKFIASYFDATEEGNPVNFFLFPLADTPENVAKVAAALAKRFF
jgi:hypothetical protein